MHSHRATTIATYSVLSLAGAVSLSLPDSLPTSNAAPQPVGNTVIVFGTVRDFHRGDAEFNISPSTGNGHYAGNLALSLNSIKQPVFTGEGFKVGSQWRNRDSHPIAPHLYYDPTALRLGDGVTQDKDTVLDTWDSTKGPYGPGNTGPMPGIVTGWPMPSILEPAMGPSTGDYFNRDFVVIDKDIHCNNFACRRDTIFSIVGNVTIFCENDFRLDQLAIINVTPGSSLKIYSRGLIRVAQGSTINMMGMNPALVTIYNLGTTTIEINQGSSVCARIVSPNAGMHLAQADHVYGTFVGRSIELDQTTGFHLDTSPEPDDCGNMIDDEAGSASASGTGGIPSSGAFDKWFNDFMGTNLSMTHPIELVRNNTGVYEYLDDAFYPADGILFGNEGDRHNFYFTYAFSIRFAHRACDGRFFEFQGADDAWAFVDGGLAMDLGGIIPGTSQYVDMDRLGLADGETYTLHFFYAQRNASTAVFRLRTNLDILEGQVPTTVSAAGD